MGAVTVLVSMQPDYTMRRSLTLLISAASSIALAKALLLQQLCVPLRLGIGLQFGYVAEFSCDFRPLSLLSATQHLGHEP